MNSPAKARRVSVGLALAATLAPFAIGPVWLAPRTRPAGELSTPHLADPLELTADGQTHRITRVVVNFDRQTLTLERGELSFNDYGDATRTGGAEPLVLPARVRPERVVTRLGQLEYEHPGLFEIVPDRPLQQRLRVVARPDTPTDRRLLVGGRRLSSFEAVSEQNLELRESQVVPDELGDRPQPDTFVFGALAPRESNGGPRLATFSVSGSLASGGRLSIDRNWYSFSPDGRVCGSTCVYFPPTEVTFKPLGPDPANRGRRAFELVLAPVPQAPKGETHILVLGPTELSEHRLVIKANGRVRQVLSLRNTARDNHLFMLRKLGSVPVDEQLAFRELGAAGNYTACVEVSNGHVVSLHSLEGNIQRLDPILARFPHLTHLGFQNATLPATGLPCLEKLNGLLVLDFSSCDISDAGLASVGKATGLRWLHSFNSQGPTPAGFAHLAPLTNLESLDIRREDAPPNAPTFDEAVKHLAGMTRLTRLNLHGLHLTDAGVAHIGRLSQLRELYVSGSGVTRTGLKHLEGLTQLAELTIYAHVPPEAIAALRTKLPNLRK